MPGGVAGDVLCVHATGHARQFCLVGSPTNRGAVSDHAVTVRVSVRPVLHARSSACLPTMARVLCATGFRASGGHTTPPRSSGSGLYAGRIHRPSRDCMRFAPWPHTVRPVSMRRVGQSSMGRHAVVFSLRARGVDFSTVCFREHRTPPSRPLAGPFGQFSTTAVDRQYGVMRVPGVLASPREAYAVPPMRHQCPSLAEALLPSPLVEMFTRGALAQGCDASAHLTPCTRTRGTP